MGVESKLTEISIAIASCRIALEDVGPVRFACAILDLENAWQQIRSANDRLPQFSPERRALLLEIHWNRELSEE